MPRYFLEVSYKGTGYSGFQTQHNANTIQAEVEKCLSILNKEKIILTGSSRTDAGVHAIQNFFHFDSALLVHQWRGIESVKHFIYKMNAMLPDDIVVKNLHKVSENAHCRFDAISREYNYYISRFKDPFTKGETFFFPYKLDIDKMQQAAEMIKEHTDFTAFSKRNTQVKNFFCKMLESNWSLKNDTFIYHVKANRFLRGMVRALTATMLQVGRNKISIDDFKNIIGSRDCTKASFAVPADGLFLIAVEYPSDFFEIQ
jgi:tRNA pseudouridine38-40 synthase